MPTPAPANTFQAITGAVLTRRAAEPGALLPILHEVQDALGHVPRDVVPQIADALNLSRAEVHGVITYYHHFRSEAPGQHVVQVCRAEACQAMGADALFEHAQQRLGCRAQGGHGGTSADGAFTLNPVFCLGLCASSPAVVVDDKLHARVTPERFDRLIDGLSAPGPLTPTLSPIGGEGAVDDSLSRLRERAGVRAGT
jgi:formate dehydrogenase subunit gamma